MYKFTVTTVIDLYKNELNYELFVRVFEITKNMETINKILPFGLKVQKIIPFFLAAKLLSFAGFVIFMLNR